MDKNHLKYELSTRGNDSMKAAISWNWDPELIRKQANIHGIRTSLIE